MRSDQLPRIDEFDSTEKVNSHTAKVDGIPAFTFDQLHTKARELFWIRDKDEEQYFSFLGRLREVFNHMK